LRENERFQTSLHRKAAVPLLSNPSEEPLHPTVPSGLPAATNTPGG